MNGKDAQVRVAALFVETDGAYFGLDGGWTGSLTDCGWTCDVDQRFYGHEAIKPTWLYYVGDDPPTLLWGRAAHGAQTVRAMRRIPGGDRSSGRSRTPAAFRDLLLAMARSAYRMEVAA